MYLWARQWGIQPSEFWAMTMKEWYAEYSFNVDKLGLDNTTHAGKLTQDNVDDMLDDMELTDEQWWKKHGSTHSKS